MASFNSKVRIQVLIERPGFRDALYFSHTEFEATTDKRIQDLGDARYEAHKAYLEAAKTAPPYIPTEAELRAEKEQIAARIAEIDSQLAKR